jgi:hypothetical protein
MNIIEFSEWLKTKGFKFTQCEFCTLDNIVILLDSHPIMVEIAGKLAIEINDLDLFKEFIDKISK